MMRFILVLGFSILLSACSHFEFSSNMDKDNFNQYFKPSQVIIYEKSELNKLDYAFIGAVEGSSCQAEENDRAADIKQARTNARIKAADLYANGIVFQSCITFPADAVCKSNIICYGQAIHVDPSGKE